MKRNGKRWIIRTANVGFVVWMAVIFLSGQVLAAEIATQSRDRGAGSDKGLALELALTGGYVQTDLEAARMAQLSTGLKLGVGRFIQGDCYDPSIVGVGIAGISTDLKVPHDRSSGGLGPRVSVFATLPVLFFDSAAIGFDFDLGYNRPVLNGKSINQLDLKIGGKGQYVLFDVLTLSTAAYFGYEYLDGPLKSRPGMGFILEPAIGYQTDSFYIGASVPIFHRVGIMATVGGRFS